MTLKLAACVSGSWSDVATLVAGTNGSIAENLPSLQLPGLLSPGTYLLYLPSAGANSALSNFGAALVTDGGYGMSDGSDGLQIVSLYDSGGNLLIPPAVTYVDYPGAVSLAAVALTPDASVGLIAGGDSKLRLFANLQSSQPAALVNQLDLSSYGANVSSVATVGNGEEAVISSGSTSALLQLSGVLTAAPQVAATIAIPGPRNALALSSDSQVLLARGPSGLTIFSVTALATPVSGNVSGTVMHRFTQQADFAALGSAAFASGRGGMAISPSDSSRAVVLQAPTSSSSATLQLITGLPTSPSLAAPINLPAGFIPHAFAISFDGALAAIGGSGGVLLYSGVASGPLTLVQGPYAPAYQAGNNSYVLGKITTMAFTLDNQYLVVGDQTNLSLVVIPFSASGFSAVASALGDVSIPGDDQLVIH